MLSEASANQRILIYFIFTFTIKKLAKKLSKVDKTIVIICSHHISLKSNNIRQNNRQTLLYLLIAIYYNFFF